MTMLCPAVPQGPPSALCVAACAAHRTVYEPPPPVSSPLATAPPAAVPAPAVPVWPARTGSTQREHSFKSKCSPWRSNPELSVACQESTPHVA
eukprot:437563-Pelagomonas_calceolata.AAC.4